MVDEFTRSQVLLLFQAKDFESMWHVCKAWYESLGFTDATDQQKVDEYKWIVQQLRKYMFSKQDEIAGLNAIEDMVAKVEELIGKAPEYGEDRKKIVYNFIRDHWLYEVRDSLFEMIQMTMPEDDEEEYEEE